MVGIDGNAIQKKSVDVYGITGEFCVLKHADKAPIKVKYFQTVASNRADDASGNALELLHELKPMRERVSSEDLKDLRSLLQRDLSDYRVAYDLVPYLQGKNSIVGFFPSILVALMPKGFLSQLDDAVYPSPEDRSSEKRILKSYGNCWEVENYKIEEKVVSLARLSINPKETDFIVLDGQHRANAFRYLAGAFDEAVDEASIYSVFYQDCDAPNPEAFDAELPVTIVWFEGESGVPPQLISRKLFVDVNTNAKKVSQSRNILLDDHELAAICVTGFYSQLAELGYKMNSLSLTHSGFDCEGKFPSEFPKMAIFSPQTLHYMCSYFLLAKPGRIKFGASIDRESYGNFGEYHERLKDLCEGIDDSLIAAVRAGDSSSLAEVDALLKQNVSSKFYRVFNEFVFFKTHFKACSFLEEDIQKNGVVEISSAWEKIFKGGEGLYNAFNEAVNQQALTGKLKTYKSAVDSVNDRFVEIRKQGITDYEQAFNTLTSQAGLTGLFMGLEYAFEKDGWDDQLIDSYIDALNGYSTQQWVVILREYKSGIVSENSPKLWPSMREIFLRFIEVKKPSWSFFSKSNLQSFHPDYLFCLNFVKQKFKAYRLDKPEERPSETIQSEWVNQSIESLVACLSAIGVESYNNDSIRQKVNDEFLSQELEKVYPIDEDEVDT